MAVMIFAKQTGKSACVYKFLFKHLNENYFEAKKMIIYGKFILPLLEFPQNK